MLNECVINVCVRLCLFLVISEWVRLHTFFCFSLFVDLIADLNFEQTKEQDNYYVKKNYGLPIFFCSFLFTQCITYWGFV